MLRFRVLGTLEVEGDFGPVLVSGQRPRALLTSLLLRPGTVVPTDRLVEAIWGERLPEAPGNALQQVVLRLRGRLATGGPELSDVLSTAPAGYRLDVPLEAVDAELFERGYGQARVQAGADPHGALTLLTEALALWRGRAYEEFADSFAQAPAVRLDELRTAAEEDRVDLYLRLGRLIESVAAARDLTASHPLRDRPVELLMRALHASGRAPEALGTFREHRQRLADDLAMDPPPALRQLESDILRETVEPPSRPVPAPSGASRPRATTADSTLPLPPGELIGRGQDLALLARCVSEKQVVTLVGPGGVGKTRLALAVCHSARADGRTVWWADLTTVTPERVIDTIAKATGVEMPRGDDPAGALATSLQRADGVLCLDNAESVLVDVADVVQVLVQAAPDLTVLATSRERFGIAREHVHLLAPLALPTNADPGPAVELFLTRAATVSATPLTEEDLPDVAELCRRLDGLPLAIELGAARAPAFGIREFTEQIRVELDLLASGRRASGTRHATLRAAVDASYRLLTPEEALLFDRLSVFPGPFRLADVKAICADEKLPASTTGTLLARLVDQSLVQAGQGRFRLLDTLRAYATDKLADRDLSVMLTRHARHVVTRISELRWHDRPELEAEHVAALASMTADLHQAWDHAVRTERGLAVELAAGIHEYSYARQRRDLMDWGRQVAAWDDVQHPLLPLIWAGATAAAWGAGDLAEAARVASRIDDPEHGDDGSAVWAQLVAQAANLDMFAGRTDDAITRYRRASHLYRQGGNPCGALLEDISVCQVMAYGGRAEEARALLPALRERAIRSRSPSAISWAHFVTGEAVGDTDVQTALDAYRLSELAAAEVDDRLVLNLARGGSVALTARCGPAADAISRFADLISSYEELGNAAAQWWMIRHLAMLLERLGLDEDAARFHAAAEAHSDRSYLLMGDKERVASSLSRIRERQGDQFVDTASAAGSRLTLDEVIAAARAALQLAHERTARSDDSGVVAATP